MAFIAEIPAASGPPRFLYVSRGCKRLLGVSAHALKGNSSVALAGTSEFERKKLWQSFRVAAKTRREWVHKFPVSHAHGTHWIEAHATFELNRGAIRAHGHFVDVTKLIYARQKTRKAKERLMHVFSAEPSAVAIVDDADNISAVNPAFVELFGYTRKEIPTLAEGFQRIFSDPNYRAQILEQWLGSIAAAPEGALTAPLLACIRRKDETERFVEARTSLAGGERIVIFDDVTDRVHAELSCDRATKERDQLQSELQLQCERMPMALVVFAANQDLTISSWNPAAERIFGYRSEEVVGRSPFEFLMPADCRSILMRVLSSTAGANETVHAVNQTITKVGRRIWCEWFNMPLRDADGRVTRVQGMAQDITERINAERQLQLWSRVLLHSAEGIIICDAEQRILQVNGAFEQITGYSADEVLGKTPRILQSGRQGAEFYSDMWATLRVTGAWSGEIWNRRKNGELYLEWLSISAVRSEHQEISQFVGIFSDITARKSAEERVTHLANFDALTDLPNRVLLVDRLEQAIKAAEREGTRVGVAFIDLDRFKHANDSLGHNTGDALLQKVAKRLGGAVRSEDTVARMGGDEFVVVFRHLHSAADAAACAGPLLQALRRPIEVVGNEITVTASIGIAIFPEDGRNAQELLRNADAAMYEAKGEGRDQSHFYTGTLNERLRKRLSVEIELRNALERNQLELHYQPQVTLATGDLVGAEALIRWKHPSRGLVAAGTFIPIAEECGLIRAIDEWAFGEGVRQCAEWRRGGMRLVPVAINVATTSFHEKGFADRIARTIAHHNVDPRQIELEVTESLMMRDIDASVGVMRRLHGMGMRLSIDDFGTGYSSLSYLMRLPIQKIKIDRSFVRELTVRPESCALVGGIAALAKNLGLTVLAEGVETAEQLRLLGEQGCDEVQGFLLSQPVPVTEFERLVRGWKPVGEDRGVQRSRRRRASAP